MEWGLETREGSCHAGAGMKKQTRIHLAGQEILERSDTAHRKSKAKKYILKEERGGTGAQLGSRGNMQLSCRKQGRHMKGWASTAGGSRPCPIP